MSVTVTFVLKDDGANPIDNVNAKIFDDSDSYIGSITTDVAGEATFLLDGIPDPGLSYIIRWSRVVGYLMQNGQTQIFRVHEPVVPPATNTFDFTIEEIAIPESDEDSMCLISGYLADVSKQPIKGGILAFLPRIYEPTAKVSGFPFPTQPAVVDGRMLVNEVRARTNEEGYLEIKLPRTAVFDVHLYGMETPAVQIYSQIYVPDRLGAKLEDVLLPYVAEVDTELDTVNIAVDEVAELTIEATGSNDQSITDSSCLTGLLEFTSSDEDVVQIALGDEGKLLVTGVSAGSATISVARVEDTSAPRVPAIPALIVSPSTTISVTVT